MISLLCILIGAISFALYTTYIAGFLEKTRDASAGYTSSFVVSVNNLSMAVYVCCIWLVLYWLGYVHIPITLAFWIPAGLSITLNLFFELLRFRAYSLTDVSLIAPFAGISPVLTVITGWFILGEFPSIGGIVGTLIIAISLYCLYINTPWSLRGWYKPFVSLWSNKGARYGFIASIPPALSIVFDKQATIASHPITFIVVVVTCVGIMTTIIDAVTHKTMVSFFKQYTWKRIQTIATISSLRCIATTLFSFALLFDVVSNVSALRRVVIVFDIIFAYIILKQTSAIKKRMAVGIGVVVGVICIAFWR